MSRGKNGARGYSRAGFPLAGVMVVSAAMLYPASGTGAEESGGMRLRSAPDAALLFPQAVVSATLQDKAPQPCGTTKQSNGQATVAAAPDKGCRPERGAPTGPVELAASHPAETELQPTAGWRERNDPESWFRGAPVTKGPDAEESEYPKTQGYSELNLEYDRTLGEGFDDTLVNIRSDILQDFSPTLFLASNVWVVFDGEDDGLRTYNTDIPFEGVYIRKLKLQKETDEYALFGGKFEPGYRLFGYAPIFFGNYSTDLNLEERTGIGGALFLKKQENRELRLTAQAFFLDQSRLSGELFSGKARNGITEGQVGDTGNLDNFFLSLNGGAIDWDPGLRYSLGLSRQRPGDDVAETEHALRGAAYYIHRLNEGGDLEFSVDLLRLENAGGFNEDNESITLGGGYSNWPAYAGLAYSVREVEDFRNGGNTRTDRIVELVVRKGITESTLVEAAYQYADEWSEVERNFGIVFRYYGDWTID